MTPWTVACQAPLFMGILQAGILEWVAISSSRGSSWPGDQTWVSHITGRFFTIWATRRRGLQLWVSREFQLCDPLVLISKTGPWGHWLVPSRCTWGQHGSVATVTSRHVNVHLCLWSLSFSFGTRLGGWGSLVPSLTKGQIFFPLKIMGALLCEAFRWFKI